MRFDYLLGFRRLRRDRVEGAAVEGSKVGGIMPRTWHCLRRSSHSWGERYCRKEGVRERSEASAGSTKSKGPWRKNAGSVRGIVSAQAMYLEGLGVVVGWNSTRSW